MELKKENQLEIYKNINFYNKYKSISDSFQFENTFESFSKDEVVNILKKIGYSTIYHKKGVFFELEEIKGDIKFYFIICLKYGLVELIIGATNIKTNSLIMGSTFGNISDDIENSLGINNIKKIFLPSFRNYDDLKEILPKVLEIYEDFKKEFCRYLV